MAMAPDRRTSLKLPQHGQRRRTDDELLNLELLHRIDRLVFRHLERWFSVFAGQERPVFAGSSSLKPSWEKILRPEFPLFSEFRAFFFLFC